MSHVIQPFHLVVFSLAGWLNRQQQATIDNLIEKNRKRLTNYIFPGFFGFRMMMSSTIGTPRVHHESELIEERAAGDLRLLIKDWRGISSSLDNDSTT